MILQLPLTRKDVIMIHSGLSICSFYIKMRYSKKDVNIINLNNKIEIKKGRSLESYQNIWDLMNIFLNSHMNPQDDIYNMKLFYVEPDSIRNENKSGYQAISCIINSGSYGVEGKITNRASKNVMYNRTQDDADVKQFRMLIFIPKDKDNKKVQKGILIFQTIGSHGVKTITTKKLKEFFAIYNMTLEIRSVSARLFFEKILKEGVLNKLTLFKNSISPDSTDSLLISSGREEKVFIKPKLKEKWTAKLLEFVDGKKDNTIFEINNEIFDDISITFGLSGRIRTARLNDLDRFSLTEDIPDNIYNNGMANEDELIKYMIDTALEYKENMVFTFSE